MARNRIRPVLAAALLVGSLAGPAQAQNVLPSGGHVVAGSAAIAAPSGNTLTINQNSNRAVVNWNNFSVGQPNAVDFIQPSSSAAILNRVTGATPSTIAGQIDANGQVYLVNPNGIAITRSGSVQVGGGFVASTLGIATGDFMSGNLAFTGNGASAGVSNAGRIGVGAGGYAALIGGTAANSGVISVPLGRVALGSGEQATLDLNGDGFMQVAVPTGATTAKGQALVSNSGRIDAAGGRVELRAATVATAIRDAVNMSGVVAANSASGRDGSITLSGGPGGAVNVGGTLDASAGTARSYIGGAPGGGNGGAITVAGSRVRVGRHAIVNASGAKGGKVLVGVSGPNGQDEAAKTTIASGAQILANGSATVAGSGGYIETSGVALKLGNATIEAGRGGTWLTDPSNLIIDATAATVIDNALAAGTNVIEQTTATGFSGVGNVVTGNGDIDVMSALAWNSSATLTLSAFNNITVSAPITVSGGGTLVLTYNNNQGGINTAGGLTFVLGQGSAQFTPQTAGQALFINNGTPVSGNGTPYTLVYTSADLANINTHTSGGNVVGNYAIAASINLGGAAHSAPVIGNDAVNFNGTLEGLGNTISNVTINSGNALVGFISVINGTVRNLALGVDVTATNTTGGVTGGLAAFNEGTISNVATSGSVSATVASAPGNPAIGGLVGTNQGSISLSSSTAQVSGTGNGSSIFVGGLAGLNEGSIDQSFAAGTVTSTATSITGFVGGLAGSSDSLSAITNSYALGNVSATQTGADIGGLVGRNGLFGGDASAISASFAGGTVSGVAGDRIGGLIGVRNNIAGISNAYWDTSSSGTLTGVGTGSSSGIAGVTTATLGSALPNGFSSSVWGNVNNQISPYILTNPGPVLIGSEEGTSPPLYTLVFNTTQLQAINSNLSGNYALAQDIDATGYGGFTPIGSAGFYTGTFNGLGNVVANLTINSSASTSGLFGVLQGTIKNLGVVGGSVTDLGAGLNAVAGGLVGASEGGTILNSYSTASVISSAFAGGLVGINDGTITNSYATGPVSGDREVGGLAGRNLRAITDSYATGTVTGVGASVGGLVGSNNLSASTITRAYAAGAVSLSGTGFVGGFAGVNSGTITNGYWNADRSASGTPNVGGGSPVGVTALSSTTSSPFTPSSYAGFTFVTTSAGDLSGDKWVMVNPDGSFGTTGGSTVAGTMPMLASEYQTTIQNAHQLQLMAMNGAGSYTLGRSIDAATTGSSTGPTTGADVWASAGFVPIVNLTGTFSGLSRIGAVQTIANLTINDTVSIDVGLIGVNAGTISNVGLINASVTNSSSSILATTGDLIGDNEGLVFNSFASGSVGGSVEGLAGGLAGNNGGTIRTSFAASTVSGSNGDLGGLVGQNSGAITDTYAIGAVTGTNATVGGLVGINTGTGTITDAYATGALIINGGHARGLVGTNTAPIGAVTDGYYDAGTTGKALGAQADGSTGLTTTALQAFEFNDTANFQNPAKWGILSGSVKSYPYLCWQFGGCGETPQVVNGTVYKDLAGTSAAGSGIAVTAFINGAQVNSVLGSTVSTGANGYYYDLFAPNTIPPFRSVLTFAQNYSIGGGQTASGATLSPANGASAAGLNILANSLYAITNETAYSAVVSDLDTAAGLTGTAATLVAGLQNLRIDAASSFNIDAGINTRTLTLNAGGAISETGNITATTLTGSSAGDTALNNNANIIQNVASFSTTTGGANGNFTLLEIGGSGLNIVGALNAGTGTVTLTNVSSGLPAASAITEQTGGSITAAALTGSASGSAFFQQPGNQIANLGPFTETNSANFALIDARSLNVSGALDAGSAFISLTTTGAGSNLVLNANLNAGNSVALNSAGTITQPTGVITTGTLTGGSVGGATFNQSNLVATFGPWTDTGVGSTGISLSDARTLGTNGAISSTGPVALATTSGNLIIGNALALGTISGTSFTGTAGSGAQIILSSTTNGSTVATTGGGQTYNSPIVLGVITLLTDSANGPITFNSTIDGTAPGFGTEGLTANTTGTGVVTFKGAVGSTNPLLGLSVSGGSVIDANVTTIGGQGYLGPVTLGNANGTTIALVTGGATTNASVEFFGTVDGTTSGQQGLTVNTGASGSIVFAGNVGGSVPLASLAGTGSSIGIAGNVSTGGAQNYTGPVTLVGLASTLNSTANAANSAIGFTGAIDGSSTLTVAADSGAVTFGGTVGGLQALTSLAATGGTIALGGAVTTNGAISLTTTTGNLTLGANLTTTSGTVTLNSAGTVSQTGGVITAATVTGSSVGGASLTSPNLVTTLGPFSNTTSGDISFTNAQALVSASVSNASGNIVLQTNSGGMTLSDDITATGHLVTLVSNGSIQQTGGVITAQGLTGSSVGGAILTDANQLATFALFSNTTSGPIRLTNAQSLAIGGLIVDSAGGITLTTTGAGSNLTLNAGLTATGNTVSLISAGTITQNSGVITAATVTGSSVGGASMPDGNNVANFGAWTDTGIGSTGIKFTSGLTLTTAGTISSTGPITLSAITEPDLILNTNINSGGTLTLFANGNINQTGGGITAPGLVASTQLDAGGAITLNSATNAITGNVTLTSLNTAGTALAGGAINLTDGNSITIASAGGLNTGIATTAGVTLVDSGNLTIAAGAKVTGGGVALAATGNFINNEGADAVTATGGNRWLIYSNTPATDTFGSLNSGNTAIWGAPFASLPPASVTATGNRYLFAQTQTLTVTTTNLSKTYGQDATAAVASAFTETGFASGIANAFLADTAANVVTGTPSVTSTGSAAAASVAGGPYPIVAAAGSLTLANGYSLAFANTGRLTVNPAALTAAIIGNPTKIYDGITVAALASGNFTLSGFVGTDGATVSAPTGAYATANVGTSIPVSANLVAGNFTANGGTSLSNYTLPTTAAGTGAITPAALTAAITGNPTKVYDGTTVAALVAGNFTLSGFIAGQGATVSALTGAYATANAGTGIGVSSNLVAGNFTADTGTSLGNYTLPTTASGVGTISPKGLTVTAANESKVYGNTFSFAGNEFTVSGLVASDSVTSLSLASAGTAATAGVGASPYPITASAAMGTGLSNYAITYIVGNLTVNPRPITVTADSLTRPFNQPNPPLTFMVTAGNLVNGDALSGGLATAAIGNSPAGAYPITQGTLAATSNYTLTFVGGTLVITPVAPLVTSTIDFGASPDKYIPPVLTVETSPSSLAACSAADLASTLERTASVVIFGPPPLICGAGHNM